MKIVIEKFPTHIAKTDNKVAANKMIKINNQAIYNSNLNRFARNIVMDNLHKYLEAQISPYKNRFIKSNIDYPISINIQIHTVINHGSISMRSGKLCWKPAKSDYVPNWDIENLASMWIKAINDVLQHLKMIPDDNIKYVNKISYEFVEVKDLEDRKIIIEIS